MSDHSGDHQHTTQDGKNQVELVRHLHWVRNLSKCPRRRCKHADFSSSGRTWVGSPNVTVQSSGSGKIVPLGITRYELSIHAGTNSTSGRWRAISNMPAL